MSSSPVGGTIRWPDGKNVEVTFSANDFDISGDDVLGGSAPVTGSGDKCDVDAWMDLALELDSLVTNLLN